MSAGARPPPPYSAPSRSARRPPTPHAVSSVLARHFPGATFNGTIIASISLRRSASTAGMQDTISFTGVAIQGSANSGSPVSRTNDHTAAWRLDTVHLRHVLTINLLKAHEAAVAAKAAAAKVAATSASVSASATSGSPVSEPVCPAAGISADPAASAATTSAEPAGRDEKDTKVM
ncbi:hypothetical protein LTR33_012286 [Friedmanniomyces endolithicus]|nr:hypothetical protein LTR33_012286 [Friedmanniomyces endolithicus]